MFYFKVKIILQLHVLITESTTQQKKNPHILGSQCTRGHDGICKQMIVQKRGNSINLVGNKVIYLCQVDNSLNIRSRGPSYMRKNFLSRLFALHSTHDEHSSKLQNEDVSNTNFGNAVNHDSHFLSEPIDNNLDESAIQYMDNLQKFNEKL